MNEEKKRDFMEALSDINDKEYITVSKNDFTIAMADSTSKEIHRIEAVAKEHGMESSIALTLAIITSNAAIKLNSLVKFINSP